MRDMANPLFRVTDSVSHVAKVMYPYAQGIDFMVNDYTETMTYSAYITEQYDSIGKTKVFAHGKYRYIGNNK